MQLYIKTNNTDFFFFSLYFAKFTQEDRMLIIDKETSYRFTRPYTIELIIDYNEYNALEEQFYQRLIKFGGDKVKVTKCYYPKDEGALDSLPDPSFSEEFNKKLDDIYDLKNPR